MKIQNINGFEICLTGDISLITAEIEKELKEINPTIFFQDNECYYWIFDFKISGVWFEMPHQNTLTNVLPLKIFQ